MSARDKIKKHVLLVDDEPAILAFLRALLSSRYVLAEATTAEGALELLKAQKFDLLVTDKNLPGKNGLELAREARKLNPEARTVIITGYQSVASVQEATELGVVDYLVKPLTDLGELRERIAAAIVAAPRPSPGLASKRVLVFEDDPVASKAVSAALAKLGLEAEVYSAPAGNGATPLHAVVVSWELAAAPHEQALNLGRSLGVPYIVLTLTPSIETTIASLRAGAVACLPKLTSDEGALSRELERALKTAKR